MSFLQSEHTWTLGRAILARVALAGTVAAAAGCGGSPQEQQHPPPPPPPTPAKFDVTVAANPESVCSAIVTFTLKGAKSAHVVATGGEDHLTTPTHPVDDTGKLSISVLGLAAKTDYAFVVEAEVDGKTRSSSPVSFKTSPLPQELLDAHFVVTAHSGKPSSADYYLVEGTGLDIVAFDGKGVIRWYRQFHAFAAETKMQPDGTFTTFNGSTMGFQPLPGQYVRYHPDGTLIGNFEATSPDTSEAGNPAVYTDNHDLLLTTNAGGDHFHVITYEMRPLASATAAWHMVQRTSMNGSVEFQWKTWSRFTEADLTDPLPGDAGQDFDHMNALSLDPSDGNYIVSLRNLDAVVKVDQGTGNVLWQIGGMQSTMKVDMDPLVTFYGQHDAHLLPNGNLLMVDNGVQHMPPESRAAEYAIDTKAGTATLVWEFRHTPAIYTSVLGSATRLSNGNTLVAFGLTGVVDEVAPDGTLVWEGKVEVGTAPLETYRVLPLPSLYEYAAP